MEVKFAELWQQQSCYTLPTTPTPTSKSLTWGISGVSHLNPFPFSQSQSLGHLNHDIAHRPQTEEKKFPWASRFQGCSVPTSLIDVTRGSILPGLKTCKLLKSHRHRAKSNTLLNQAESYMETNWELLTEELSRVAKGRS